MLNIMPQITIPKKTKNNRSLRFQVALLTFKRIYPTSKLKQAHNTLQVGEESPLPGGLAKGVGKGSPEIP